VLVWLSFYKQNLSPLNAKCAGDYENETRAGRERKLTFNNCKGFLISINDSWAAAVNMPECSCQSRSLSKCNLSGENSRWKMKIQRWKFQSNEGTEEEKESLLAQLPPKQLVQPHKPQLLKNWTLNPFFRLNLLLMPCILWPRAS